MTRSQVAQPDDSNLRIPRPSLHVVSSNAWSKTVFENMATPFSSARPRQTVRYMEISSLFTIGPVFL